MRLTTDNKLTWIVLALCHIAGMLDLVILPLWVGGMMQDYGFQPFAAGGMVTIYLVGTLISNAILARSFGKLPEKLVAVVGFAVPAVAFYLMTYVPGITFLSSFAALAILHFIGGAGAGAGLVMVHGLIGRSSNPHRLFAVVNGGVSLWAILFFAITPGFMATMGVNAVFMAAALIIGIATIAALVGFPSSPAMTAARAATSSRSAAPALILGLCFAGVVALQTSEAMTFSFVERIGTWRGFGVGRIANMLVAASFVPLLAPILAGLMQNRFQAINVAIGGLMFHGLLSATISNSPSFLPYAVASSLMISTVIFTHTFVFGLLAKLDPSGRTNAATPSMLMIGTAIGSFVGGAVGEAIGLYAIGTVALCVTLVGAGCFLYVKQYLQTAMTPAPT